MPFRWSLKEHLVLGRYAIKWLLVGVPTGVVVGSAVAGFLWLLERAIDLRQADPWLLFLLPAGGVAVGLAYHRFGKGVEGGNNLILEQIHAPGGGVPARMTPLVLAGTVLTHLFGGSAGREGTAVQMGGSLAAVVGRLLRLDRADTATLLQAGIAAGFGAVFGTPLTGAIFALEVLSVGLVSYGPMVPCLIAAVAGDYATRAWGIHHTGYTVRALVGNQLNLNPTGDLSAALLAKVAVAAVAFGLASVVFAELTHGLHKLFATIVPVPYLRPAVGGAVVIGLAYAVGPSYLGLGVTNPPGQVSILTCFQPGGATALSWWWKILFTAVTLAAGFKGGEVTPLFFVGAALGNAMARLLHEPTHVDLFAGLGFVGVFAGATNTPLACTVMGVELFAASAGPGWLDGGLVVYLATSCFVAYLMSGHTGVYLSQRIGSPKLPAVEGDAAHADLRTARGCRPFVGRGLFAKRGATDASPH